MITIAWNAQLVPDPTFCADIKLNNGLSLQVVVTGITVDDENETVTMDFDWPCNLRIGVYEFDYSSGKSTTESTYLYPAHFKSIGCTV